MIHISIHTFAVLKDRIPDGLVLEFQQQCTISEVQERLKKEYPEMDVMDNCRFAINEEFVSSDSIISDDTEVFIIPPSSGG